MSRRFELTFPEPLWERVEEARGHESRASFVKRAVEAALGNGETGSSRVAPESAVGHGPPMPPQAPADDVHRREPDPRMFHSAADHRRAMVRFERRGEW